MKGFSIYIINSFVILFIALWGLPIRAQNLDINAVQDYSSLTYAQKYRDNLDLEILQQALGNMNDVVKVIVAKRPAAVQEMHNLWQSLDQEPQQESIQKFLDYVQIYGSPEMLAKADSAFSSLADVEVLRLMVGSQSSQWTHQFYPFVWQGNPANLNDAEIQFATLLNDIETNLVLPNGTQYSMISKNALLFELANSFWMMAFIEVGLENQIKKQIPGSSQGLDLASVSARMKERTHQHHKKLLAALGYTDLAQLY